MLEMAKLPESGSLKLARAAVGLAKSARPGLSRLGVSESPPWSALLVTENISGISEFPSELIVNYSHSGVRLHFLVCEFATELDSSTHRSRDNRSRVGCSDGFICVFETRIHPVRAGAAKMRKLEIAQTPMPCLWHARKISGASRRSDCCPDERAQDRGYQDTASGTEPRPQRGKGCRG